MAGNLVLLTGATGMIGFRTMILLLEAGYQVRAAVLYPAEFEKTSNLKPVLPYKSQLESIVVPDITVEGAYDEAVKGVKYIVHIASPLGSSVPPNGDFETLLIQPAIRGTVGMLESASKATGIRKVVITGSILSLSTFAILSRKELTTEQTRRGALQGPYESQYAAYGASKALALDAAEKYIAEKKPSYDVINIFPSYTIGRDETVTEAQDITRGSNGMLMYALLGIDRQKPLFGGAVHLDDVARLHVLALGPEIEGNHDFIANVEPLEDQDWARSFDIVKRRFPEAYAEGVFKFESIPRPVTIQIHIDGTKAEKTFAGFKYKSYEEQVVSVVEHYLELLGKN
ncbi:Ketoreductase CTB6 [Cladobotryum mycophilum]|uniref:Ketoreductase CTB6 n=1 Tax=Cladobotryum mycophilum TaxID=491253 RepID=A0ABR0STM7_9HYPO